MQGDTEERAKILKVFFGTTNMIRSLVIYLNPDTLLLTGSDEGMAIKNAVEAIKKRVPDVIVGQSFPSMLAIHMKAPETALPALYEFLESAQLGTYHLDEGHSLAGA